MASISTIHAAPEPSQDAPSLVDSLPGPGEHERAVLAQLARYGELATADCPGMATLCTAMARILDNPALSPQWPPAAGQLRAALLVLEEASKASRSKASGVRMLRAKHVG